MIENDESTSKHTQLIEYLSFELNKLMIRFVIHSGKSLTEIIYVIIEAISDCLADICASFNDIMEEIYFQEFNDGLLRLLINSFNQNLSLKIEKRHFQ